MSQANQIRHARAYAQFGREQGEAGLSLVRLESRRHCFKGTTQCNGLMDKIDRFIQTEVLDVLRYMVGTNIGNENLDAIAERVMVEG